MASWFPSKGHPLWCQILPKLAGWEDFVWKIILYRYLIILNHITKKCNGVYVLFTWNSVTSWEELFWEFNASSVKELHRFYSRFILYKIQRFIPEMSQINSAHSSPYCMLNIYFNILPSTPSSSKWPSQVFQTNSAVNLNFAHYMLYHVFVCPLLFHSF
jgi:hypothetical protein